MKQLVIVAIAAAVAHGAFAAAPPEPVTSANVDVIIREGLRRVLKDPNAIDLRITKAPILGRVTTAKRDEAGYLVCGELNAKNSYGAFVGVKDYLFVVDPSTHAVKALERLDPSMLNTDAWRKVCYLSPPEVAPVDQSAPLTPPI